MFYLYDNGDNYNFYETSCLESLTKRYRNHNHEITVSWEEKIPDFILEVFSKFFNFTYTKSTDLGYTRFSFDKNGSDYIPSIVFRLIRDRTSYGLTNDIIKEGMDSIINKLIISADFKRELLFYDSKTEEPDYIIPKEIIFATYLMNLEKYDSQLKSFSGSNGIIGALFSLLINSDDFKKDIENTLEEYYSEKEIEIKAYRFSRNVSYGGNYEYLTVNKDTIVGLLEKWILKRKEGFGGT